MVEGYLVPNMISNSNSLMLMMVLILVGTGPGICHGEDGCGGHRCGRHGPPIRFPFRLKDKEPPHCGYPAFDLTCSDSHDTFIEFSASPVPLKLLVTDIQYEYNYFRVSDTQNCLPTHLLKLIKNSSSISPFQFSRDQTLNDVSFFNCSPDPQYQLSCPIYVADSYDSLLSSNLVSCTKIFDISSTFYDSEMVDLYNTLNLWWSKPNCSMCETQGKRCKLKNNGTQGEVECFRHHHNNLLFGSTGLILLAAVATAVFKIYQHFRMKGEDRARIDNYLQVPALNLQPFIPLLQLLETSIGAASAGAPSIGAPSVGVHSRSQGLHQRSFSLAQTLPPSTLTQSSLPLPQSSFLPQSALNPHHNTRRNTKWRFLEGVRVSGALPPRTVLVQQCICDEGVLEVLCNYVSAQFVFVLAAPSKKFQPSRHVSWGESSMIQAERLFS
ncbi:hypothetical protein Ahy_B10g100582 isoform B [Arachis hypogaea]|nr:hypothetical protein Ahy_B10g100582 isoform B [Arachis hypogaea]